MKEAEQLNQIAMWSKVNKLKSVEHLSISQISRNVGIDRKTVRKLLGISLDDFLNRITNVHREKKLSQYDDFILSKIHICNDISSASIEDKLKERYGDSIQVSSKTVYNYVQYLRKKHDLPKITSKVRDMAKWEDTPYGEWGQVDFGSENMPTIGGFTIKIYFMVIVLSRSRAKFVYLQTLPFTSASAIYAHQLSFEYFGGVPQKLLYDQDSVFIKDENLGDYLHTAEFSSYVVQEGFQAIYCRKADPQTKGKVENSVGFVKSNFLSGRIFKNIHSLNEQAVSWLERTGNGKVHETTKLIPLKELEIERKYLNSIKLMIPKGEKFYKEYTVIKDNTLRYKGNIYSLPVGTYTGHGSKVNVFPDGDDLYIYDLKNKEIAHHTISSLKGQYIKNSSHGNDKSSTIAALKNEMKESLGGSDIASKYLDLIEKDRPRYFRASLLKLKKSIPLLEKEIINTTLKFCVENNIYNAFNFIKIAVNNQKEQKSIENFTTPKEVSKKNRNITKPNRSNISTYQNIMSCKN